MQTTRQRIDSTNQHRHNADATLSQFELTHPFHVHVYALMWMAGCATSVATSVVVVRSAIEMIFTGAAIVSGKLKFMCCEDIAQ